MRITEPQMRLFQTRYSVNGKTFLAGIYANSEEEAVHAAELRGLDEVVLGEVHDAVEELQLVGNSLAPNLEQLYKANRIADCIRGVLFYSMIQSIDEPLQPGGLVWQLTLDSTTNPDILARLIELESGIPGTEQHYRLFCVYDSKAVIVPYNPVLLN